MREIEIVAASGLLSPDQAKDRPDGKTRDIDEQLMAWAEAHNAHLKKAT